MTALAAVPQPNTPECDGLCVSAADIGVGRADLIAYPHPSCPLHAPGEVCECGQPDRCLSPTHDPAWVNAASPEPAVTDLTPVNRPPAPRESR